MATKFYPSKGIQHFWPDVRGWSEVNYDDVDIYENVGSLSYQENSSGVIVSFVGGPLETGKGKATWDFEWAGEEKKGTFISEDQILGILDRVSGMLAGIEKRQLRKVPKIPGWKLQADASEIVYYKDYGADYGASVSTMDIGNFLAGEGVSFSFYVSDTGGYRAETLFDGEVTISLRGLKAQLTTLDKQARKIIG